MDAYAEEDLQIEVQRTPAKTNPITKQTIPAQVTMAEADYLVLKERAAASSWIRKAMEDLKYLGAKLTRELNQRRRKGFLNRSIVCVKSVTSLVKRNSACVYHKSRLVLENEKFYLIFNSLFGKYLHTAVFTKASCNSLFY